MSKREQHTSTKDANMRYFRKMLLYSLTRLGFGSVVVGRVVVGRVVVGIAISGRQAAPCREPSGGLEGRLGLRPRRSIRWIDNLLLTVKPVKPATFIGEYKVLTRLRSK